MNGAAAPRVLYLMHVDVRWIKQRPHFLAAELRVAGCAVDVRYLRAWRARQLAPAPGLDDAHPLPAVPPLSEWVRWRLNALLARVVLSVVTLRAAPDVVWLTHPRLWWCVPRRLRDRVVYDAMDIAAAFPGRATPYLLRSERQLCEQARTVVCSSRRIAQHLAQTYGRANGVALVRNALDDRTDWAPPAAPPAPRPRLLYYGTVAEWLDLPLLLAALEAHPDLVIELVGPAEVTVPKHPRLLLRPPVEHAALPALAAGASALVMPFRVTELIEGVDPVKLYEYVALRRPAIACWYPEVEHFRAAVHLYRDRAEFLDLVAAAVAGSLPPQPCPEEFLAGNSWRARAGQVLELLEAQR